MSCVDLRFPSWMKEGNNTAENHNVSTVNHLGVLRFPGKVKYYNNFYDCGAVSERLFELAEAAEELILGFDLEWPFSYKSGPGKTALVQICLDKDICYLFHVSFLQVLPRGFIFLIRHPKVKLVGLNIKNDIRKLGRDFGFNVNQIIQNNVIELSTYANEKLFTSERWSLDRLVLNQLNVTLEKPQNVRMSDWSQKNLSTAQLVYAATDAYASLLCYEQLNKVSDILPTVGSDLCDQFSKLGAEIGY